MWINCLALSALLDSHDLACVYTRNTTTAIKGNTQVKWQCRNQLQAVDLSTAESQVQYAQFWPLWPLSKRGCFYTCELTRHRASTSMYSLTFRNRITTPPQYGRNGTVHAAGASILSLAYVVCVCGMRAVGLVDYRWALPRISIVLP